MNVTDRVRVQEAGTHTRGRPLPTHTQSQIKIVSSSPLFRNDAHAPPRPPVLMPTPSRTNHSVGRILLYDLSIFRSIESVVHFESRVSMRPRLGLLLLRHRRPPRTPAADVTPVVRKLKEKLLEKAMLGFNGDSTALLHCKAYEYSTHYYVQRTLLRT